ncbi:MAG: hypothetical protein M3010_02160 [Candidatus Dormibacteraeota bacterium]|nr:hypothetical protein [Candidatus Dormibacteraeota bacterium]
MLPSRTILDLVSQPPSLGLKGKIAYHQRAQRTSMNAFNGPSSHQRFLDDLAAQCETLPPPTATASGHPADDPRARSVKPVDGLAPSDLAWLTRLPADPAQVPYDDAVSLASLASGLSAFKYPSDARLLQSVWQPVKEIHDANAARVALDQAQTPVPSVPSSALSALTDAIAAEVPQLDSTEAVARAGAQLRDTLDKRTAARDTKIMDARAAIAAASEAAARRTAVTR